MGCSLGFNPQFFPKLEGVAKLFSRLTTAASLWVHIVTINLFFAKVCYVKGVLCTDYARLLICVHLSIEVIVV